MIWVDEFSLKVDFPYAIQVAVQPSMAIQRLVLSPEFNSKIMTTCSTHLGIGMAKIMLFFIG